MSRLGLRFWGDFEPMAVEEVGAAGTDDGLAVRRATGGQQAVPEERKRSDVRRSPTSSRE
jgi:hypothetical protein